MIYDSKWIWGPAQTCPFLLENRDFFSVFTSRFLIAFARPHENAIVTDNNITLWEHAYIMVSLSVTLFFSKASVFIHSLGSFSTTTAMATRTATKNRFILAKQQLCTCSTLFCTFLCRHCTTATWNSLKWRFMVDVNTRLQINFPFSR